VSLSTIKSHVYSVGHLTVLLPMSLVLKTTFVSSIVKLINNKYKIICLSFIKIYSSFDVCYLL